MSTVRLKYFHLISLVFKKAQQKMNIWKQIENQVFSNLVINTATCQRRKKKNTEALIKLLKRDKDIFTTEYKD